MSLLKFKYGTGKPTLAMGEIGISTDLNKIFVNPDGTQISIDNYLYKAVDNGTAFATVLASMEKIAGTFYVVKDTKTTEANYTNKGSALYYYDGTNFVELSNTGDLAAAIAALAGQITALDTNKANKTDLDSYVKKTGDTMSAALHMGAGTDGATDATYNKITHVATPTDAHDAANKAYVDALEAKLDDVTTVMNFVGTITPSGENVSAGKHGDVGIATNGKEYVFISTQLDPDEAGYLTIGSWHELGDVNAQNTAITDLQKLLYSGANGSATSTSPAADTVMKDIDDLQATVGTNSHTDATDPLKDKTLWDAVSDLRDDLGQKSDDATAETADADTVNEADAFARLKRLEASLGRKADAANKDGSAYARIAKNASDITGINTSVTQIRKELGTAPTIDNTTGLPNIWDCLTWHTW
jgi:hypothetical protein